MAIVRSQTAPPGRGHLTGRFGAHPVTRAATRRNSAAAEDKSAAGTAWLARLGVGKLKVKSKDLAIFTRQFGVMLGSGLPLVQALEILAEQQQNKGFGKALSGIRSSVESGSTLSGACRQYPRVFDPLYTNMLEAGETGGVLEAVLQRLAAHLEKSVKLRAAVKSALIYPVAVLVIALGVVVMLLWKVVPIFGTLFAGLNATLPLPTRLVMALSNFVSHYIAVLGLGVAGGVVALKRYYRTPRGRRVLDGVVLKLPAVGVLLRKIAVARFSRTLSTLITSGVPMLESLEITSRTAGNAVIEEAVNMVRREVEAGHDVSTPMRRSGAFPHMAVQMVAVGEQTGALDSMLQKVAEFYEDEVDVAVADLLAAMEPAIIVFLGTVVGGIVISMYLPLFSLISKLAG
ncbi:MAG TPA: type II secretion system F family protein [Terriglobia bacterium]|nr:type II secretion system F family protein [Terriglobia bacterium]